MLKTIFLCLVFFLLGVTSASFYWMGYIAENPSMESFGILFSGVTLMIGILVVTIIKAYEDREKKDKDKEA